MYKLFIVDDEKLVIEGLKATINWSELGIEIIGTAIDGKTAYKDIIEKKPNIVFTDIRMPGMNGLDLIQNVKIKEPDIVFVIFSGYSEFEYAKKAIELEAIDYLIKPIEIDEIVNTAIKAIEKYENMQEQKKNKLELDLIKPILKDKIISDVILGRLPEEDLEKDSADYTVIVLKLINYDKEFNDKQSVLDEIKEPFSCKNIDSYSFIYNDDVLLIYSQDQKSLSDKKDDFELSSVLEEISKALKYKYSIHCVYGLGSTNCGIVNIQRSYIEAKEAIIYGIFYDRKVTYFENLLTLEGESINLTELGFCEYFKDDNLYIEAVNEHIAKLINSPIQARSNPDKLRKNILDFILDLEKNLYKRFGIQLKNIFGEEFSSKDEIIKKESLSSILEWFKYINNSIYEYIASNKSSYKSKLINNVKLYIKENLNKDLTLIQISEKFNISHAYLSTMFKNECGETIFDFITMLKIEKAKELLKTSNFKIFEICDLVGYDNQRYFCQVFKKQVGITPTEFRDNLINITDK